VWSSFLERFTKEIRARPSPRDQGNRQVDFPCPGAGRGAETAGRLASEAVTGQRGDHMARPRLAVKRWHIPSQGRSGQGTVRVKGRRHGIEADKAHHGKDGAGAWRIPKRAAKRRELRQWARGRAATGR